jgi:hypothetical protein
MVVLTKLKTHKNKQHAWANNTAPYLEGLFSLQVVHDNSPEALDVTAYRDSFKEAEAWKDVMTSRGEFSCMLLRVAETSWFVYDRDGNALCQTTNPTASHATLETKKSEELAEKPEVEKRAQEFLLNEDLTLIACSDEHKDASAADASNFSVLCSRMIKEASAEDLRHVFVVSGRDTSQFDGLVADFSRLSGSMADVFIDRAKWLRNGWPLVASHHLDVLADRLARVRAAYMSELIDTCCTLSKASANTTLGVKAAWAVAGPGVKYRRSRDIVERLKNGIMLTPNSAEIFSEDVIRKNSHTILQILRA